MFNMPGGSNPLEMASQVQNQAAQTESTMLQMQQTEEKMKKTRRDSQTEILNGLTSSIDKVRI